MEKKIQNLDVIMNAEAQKSMVNVDESMKI